MADLTEAKLTDKYGKETVAQVFLNGYRSFSNHPTRIEAPKRLIWSFAVGDGDWPELIRSWEQMQPLTLHTQDGKQAPIRIAAIPVDESSFGLIEFM